MIRCLYLLLMEAPDAADFPVLTQCVTISKHAINSGFSYPTVVYALKQFCAYCGSCVMFHTGVTPLLLPRVHSPVSMGTFHLPGIRPHSLWCDYYRLCVCTCMWWWCVRCSNEIMSISIITAQWYALCGYNGIPNPQSHSSPKPTLGRRMWGVSQPWLSAFWSVILQTVSPREAGLVFSHCTVW